MSLCAIIPVKPLRRGKSRLSTILSSQQREVLNEYLLKTVLACLNEVQAIDHKIVISYDPTALALSRRYGANTVLESRSSNINRALRKATIAAQAYRATKVLILPADLPLITKYNLQEFLELEEDCPQMIISPDRKMFGTNAMLINPRGAIKYNFGDWSFRNHIEQAERKKIKVDILNNSNIAFDLDVPEDWELLRKQDIEKGNYINQLFQEVTQ